MQQELRENRFGNDAWSNLDPASRSFIATAEQVFRLHRNDAAFDLAGVVLDLAKAIEVQVNAVLRLAMQGVDRTVRYVNIDGRSRDLSHENGLSLGELARIIGGERLVNEHLKRVLTNGGWFATSLPPVLSELAVVRNAAAHRGTVDRDDVVRWRNRLVGVGCKGELLELALVRVR